MIEFDYKKERLRTGEIIYRPVAKAYILKSENNWIPEFFYVDSGADYTMIPYLMGKFLGFERLAKDVSDISGIGGVIGIRFVIVPMKIENHIFNCTIAWAQIEQTPFLLGRKDVFDRFDITFRQRDKKTIFEWH